MVTPQTASGHTSLWSVCKAEEAIDWNAKMKYSTCSLMSVWELAQLLRLRFMFLVSVRGNYETGSSSSQPAPMFNSWTPWVALPANPRRVTHCSFLNWGLKNGGKWGEAFICHQRYLPLNRWGCGLGQAGGTKQKIMGWSICGQKHISTDIS